MDGVTFNWVFTFLALNRKNNKTENYDNIYATLVVPFPIWKTTRLNSHHSIQERYKGRKRNDPILP